MGLLPNDEDARLAEVWRAHFGTPMPIYGVPAIARRILIEHGADVSPRDAPAPANSRTKAPN